MDAKRVSVHYSLYCVHRKQIVEALGRVDKMDDQIQRVLIAGGRGLIGRSVGKRLIETGREVWVLSRTPSLAHEPEGARFIGWDGKTTLGWSEIVSHVDAVIQLAGASLGSSPWTDERRDLILNSRVDSGRAVASAIKAASPRPRVLIQASAIGYYGNSEEAAFTESDLAGKGWLQDVCTVWENTTRDVEEVGVRRVVIRTGLVLDRNLGILPLMALPVRMGVGGRLGSGKQWISWIHIEDVVGAITSLMKTENATGPYNLTAPAPVRNAEFIRMLAAALDRPYWFPTPAFAIQLAVGKMSELVLQGQNVVPERLEQMGFEFSYRDLESALGAIYPEKSKFPG